MSLFDFSNFILKKEKEWNQYTPKSLFDHMVDMIK